MSEDKPGILYNRVDNSELVILNKDYYEKLQTKCAELESENARLKEVISYLPKVPTQPYEKEMAQRIAELEAENVKLNRAVQNWYEAGYADECRIREKNKKIHELEQQNAKLVEHIKHLIKHDELCNGSWCYTKDFLKELGL